MTKSSAGALCGLMMAMLVSTTVHGGGEQEWLLLDESADSNFSLDKGGVKKQSEGVIRITAQVLYTEEGKEDALSMLQPAKGYENLSESRYVYDLDCKGQKSKLLRVTHMDKKGNQIRTVDLSEVTLWEEIPTAARLELVTDLVCKP